MNERARYRRLARVFRVACELDGGERQRYVAARLAGDRELRERVEAMLAAEDERRSFASRAVVRTGGGVGALELLVAPEEERLPARIGEFHVLEEIGHGGMGTVYRAEQGRPRRFVAVKVMRSKLGAERDLHRFELEVEALGRLQHPGIAQIYQAGVVEGPGGPRPYFAMELVDGRPWLRFLEEGRPSRNERLELFAQVCDAVHHAHQRGIIHRDIKPSNVLVDAERRPRVLDFGVARAADPMQGSSEAVEFVGTLDYMSPEQAACDPDVDVRTDVYSLGVFLYETLTGELPKLVLAARLEDAIRDVRAADFLPVHAWDRSLRGDLERIVDTACARDRERRYQSADALGADVRRFLRDEPIAARRLTISYFLRKLAARHAAIAVLATIALGLFVSWWFERTTSEKERTTREREQELQLAQEALELPTRLLELLNELDWPPEEAERAKRSARALAVLDRYAPDLRTARGAPQTAERLERWRRDEPAARAALLGTLQILVDLLPRTHVPKRSEVPADGWSPDGVPYRLREAASASDQLLHGNLIAVVEQHETSALRRGLWRILWMAKADREPALTELREYAFPEHAVDFVLLARTLTTLGHTDRSREVLGDAERANLYSSAISFHRGYLAAETFRRTQQVADIVEAIAAYEGAVKLAPESAKAHANLGLAYVELAAAESTRPEPGRSDLVRSLWRWAREQYQIALDLDPESATTWFNLGCLESRRPEGPDTGPRFAEICFQAALALEPTNASWWRYYATVSWDVGPPDWTAELYRRWLEHEPTADVHDDLGQVLDQHASAIEENAGPLRTVETLREQASLEYQTALALDSTRFKTWTRLAGVRLRMNDPLGALEACEALLCCGRDVAFDGWTANEAKAFRWYPWERDPWLSAPEPDAPWRERARALHAEFVQLGAEAESELAATRHRASR